MTTATNIKHIPTELNFYHNTFSRLKRLKKQGNTSRILILLLIIWNIVLTINSLNINPIPQPTKAQNEQIVQLEEMPIEELEVL